MAETKPTRRQVIGTIVTVLDKAANIFPVRIDTLASRVDGPVAARAIRGMATALRDLEDYGVTETWEFLVEGGYTTDEWMNR